MSCTIAPWFMDVTVSVMNCQVHPILNLSYRIADVSRCGPEHYIRFEVPFEEAL